MLWRVLSGTGTFDRMRGQQLIFGLKVLALAGRKPTRTPQLLHQPSALTLPDPTGRIDSCWRSVVAALSGGGDGNRTNPNEPTKALPPAIQVYWSQIGVS